MYDFYNRGTAITPSDTVDHPFMFQALYVGGAGTVVAVLDNHTTMTLTNARAGEVYRVRGRRVNFTGTTATDMIALVKE